MKLEPGETIVSALNFHDVVLIITNLGRVFEILAVNFREEYLVREALR